ncbi:MAG: hypothetical protein N3H31_02005 [Candidatus Nezhaarchaeota archaeon]|nr:hypothetical protein [Candidatus Nezhaarchaeota archaeon]
MEPTSEEEMLAVRGGLSDWLVYPRRGRVELRLEVLVAISQKPLTLR